MANKIIILIIVISLILIVGGIGIFFLFSTGFSFSGFNPIENQANNQGSDNSEQVSIDELLEKEYSEKIQGTINFFDQGNNYNPAITTDDGKQYIIWPSEVKSIYESFGAKDGGRVEIWGKFTDDGKLNIGKIIPLE
jgi:hypothetical protein